MFREDAVKRRKIIFHPCRSILSWCNFLAASLMQFPFLASSPCEEEQLTTVTVSAAASLTREFQNSMRYVGI